MRGLLSFILFFFCLPIYAEQLIIEPDMGRFPILKTLDQAKSSIDLVMYGLTDKELIQALINAKKNGKSVKVLIEPSPYKNEKENEPAIQALRKANIDFHYANPAYKLTHQKTLITDHKNALIMTFNLTRSAFLKTRNFAVLIDNPDSVKEIENTFEADWDLKKPNVSNSSLLWSPDNSRTRLLQLIESAQKSIEIYAQDISDYETIGALAKAARHGVNIKIVTSSTKHQSKMEYLQRAGIIIHQSKQFYIHAKVMIIDHKLALVGSMNLTKPSIDSNRELSVITQNKSIINELENTFNHDFYYEYVKKTFNFFKISLKKLSS